MKPTFVGDDDYDDIASYNELELCLEPEKPVLANCPDR